MDGSAYGRRCVLGAAVLWSFSGVITKGLDLSPTTIAFYRSFFAGLALLPFVPVRRMVVVPAMVPCGLIFGLMIGLYIAAIRLTTAANAILLQCTATVWLVPASALILRERPDRRSVIGISVAAVGIAWIVLFGIGQRPGEARGIALGLASGVAYAAVVLGMRGLRGLDPIWLSSVNNLVGALSLAAAMVLVAGTWPTVPGVREMAVLAGFGVVQMAIPYTLFARGLREIPAPEAGLIGLLEPVLNPIWVWLVHGEVPAPATLVGGSLLLVGVAVRYVPRGHRARRGA
jgi:drug/metabolite transporter (DMT)-like permease